MTPGAVACVLYARVRRMDRTFLLESESCPGTDSCFILTGSWLCCWGSNSRTYSSQLVVGVDDVVTLLRHVHARMVADIEDRMRKAVLS